MNEKNIKKSEFQKPCNFCSTCCFSSKVLQWFIVSSNLIKVSSLIQSWNWNSLVSKASHIDLDDFKHKYILSLHPKCWLKYEHVFKKIGITMPAWFSGVSLCNVFLYWSYTIYYVSKIASRESNPRYCVSLIHFCCANQVQQMI